MNVARMVGNRKPDACAPQRALAAAVLIAIVALAAGGCGGGDDGGGDDGGSGSGETTATSAVEREETRAEAEAPPGASPVLREIYRQFPRPRPDPADRRSAAAIRAGERACRGKTPLEVREEFIGESDLTDEQAELVEELPGLEEKTASNSAFITGQLGALVYERTLPEDVAHYGYMGCVYSLSLVIKRKLAPR